MSTGDELPTDDAAPVGPGDHIADPVRRRRAQVQRWVTLAQRVGYSLYGVTAVLFVVGFPTGFPGWLVSAMTVTLVGGSLVLGPAIVLGYAVKAAERDDREHGR